MLCLQFRYMDDDWKWNNAQRNNSHRWIWAEFRQAPGKLYRNCLRLTIQPCLKIHFVFLLYNVLFIELWSPCQMRHPEGSNQSDIVTLIPASFLPDLLNAAATLSSSPDLISFSVNNVKSCGIRWFYFLSRGMMATEL